MKKFPKKIIIIAASVIVVIAAVVATVVIVKNKVGGASGKSVIYADTVDTIMGNNGIGAVNRYSGVVETQKSIDIKVDSDKKIKNVFVNVGDAVEVGTPLFEYDVDELNLSLQSANLEIEKLQNTLKTSNAQIEQLEKERKSASAEEKLDYTAQILTLQSTVQQTEYDMKVKQIEADGIQDSINNAVVKSTAAGIVKTIKENSNSSQDDTGYGQVTSDAFMTIVATDDFRVKGTIDETSAYEIQKDMAVLVYSRVDDSVWKGTIEEIDTENKQDNTNDYWGGSSDNSASKYAFYVKLENSDNMLIGQHVYIEPDIGQYNENGGVNISQGFIVQDEDQPYVWALDKNGKLEKRTVTLGEYNAVTDTYEITDGLSKDDYISYPSKYCKVGASAIKDTGRTIDDSIYSRDDVDTDNYYSDDDHTFTYDDSGILYEYDENGNLVSSCDENGNMTYYDADGNVIDNPAAEPSEEDDPEVLE